MKHDKRTLHLDRTTIKPLSQDELSRVAGGGHVTRACDQGSLTAQYSIKPCPYSGDC